MKTAAATIALLSLLLCLLSAVFFFVDLVDRPVFEGLVLGGSLVWFVSATYWVRRAEEAEGLVPTE